MASALSLVVLLSVVAAFATATGATRVVVPAYKCAPSTLPVCGEDGVTYKGSCQALKNGTTVKYTGTCAFPTKCARQNKKYAPVCGNCHTYANSCVAKLNGITDYTTGPCLGFCPFRPGPVCVPELSGCNAPNRCKDDPRYKCTLNTGCNTQQVLDNGKTASFLGACSPIYVIKASGFPAAACY